MKTKAQSPFLTPEQVRTQAALLTGTESRAAIEDDTTPETTEETGTTGELWLYGVVGGWWRGFDAESVSNALRRLEVDTLYVRIHSPGGYAPDGIAIGNLLRNHRARVVVVVDGLAASAASVIAIAGDEIVMCPGSQLMLHDASTIGWGNAAELRDAADWIDGQSQNYAGVYAHRGGGTPDQWREVMLANNGSGTWYTAQGAIDAGLADRVGTVVATSSPPVAPEDDLNDDDYLARAAHDLALLEQHVHPDARAAWSGQRPPKPPSASAVGSTTPKETESAVAFSDEQMKTMRAKLGLSEDADEATIVAALDESRPPATSTPTIPDGYAALPKQALEDLQAQAAAGAQAAETLRTRDRDAFLDAHKDRFPPASRAAWTKAYDQDPAGTKDYLASAPVLVPTSEIGHAEDSDTAPTSLASVREDEGYKNWKVS